MDGKPTDALASVWYLPTRREELTTIRDFLFSRKRQSERQLHDLRRAAKKDLGSIQAASWEVRICRNWLKRLIDAEKLIDYLQHKDFIPHGN